MYDKSIIHKGNENAITLITLVITIIILLILAGVTINMFLGDNGLFNKSKQSAEISRISSVLEKLEAHKADLIIEKSGDSPSIDEFLDFLNTKGILDDFEKDGDMAARITVDKYVFYVLQESNGNLKIQYEEEAGSLLPRIKNINAVSNGDSIIVNVVAVRVEDNYSYYIKDLTNNEDYGEMISSGDTYTFSGLSQGHLYKIKVEVSNSIGQVSDESSDILVLTSLSESDLLIGLSEQGWTNKDLIVTAEPNGVILNSDEYIELSNDGENWIKDSSITFSKNGNLSVRVSNGTSYGVPVEIPITTIDKDAPRVENAVSLVGGLSFGGVDDGSGIVGYKVTATPDVPTEFENIEKVNKLENQTITDIVEINEYYLWLKDAVGNVSDSSKVIMNALTFSYTGAEQSANCALPGNYKIELWGATGGTGYSTYIHTGYSYGGNGGYTSGTVALSSPTLLYIYVGGRGSNGPTNKVSSDYSISGGYNGGGSGRQRNNGNSYTHNSGSGGGATDVRLTGGAWNNFDSLKSRIMVAAGGGGGSGHEGLSTGGHAGGLTRWYRI